MTLNPKAPVDAGTGSPTETGDAPVGVGVGEAPAPTGYHGSRALTLTPKALAALARWDFEGTPAWRALVGER